MKIEFDITQNFSDDINHLTQDERDKITDQINLVSASLLNSKSAFLENASIPYIFNLKGGLESSLFLINAGNDKSIVAAVDEDPIFDKLSLTLFRVVDQANAPHVYKEVGENIYRKTGIL